MFRWRKLGLVIVLLIAGCASGLPDEPAGGGADNLRTELPNPDRDTADTGNEQPSDSGGSMTNDGCPVGACSVGAMQCEGPDLLTCEANVFNPDCGIWSAPTACTRNGETCVSGECVVVTGCVDNDGDGYGALCAAGEDCDDANDAAHIGAFELCDGVDNNCDGAVDEGYQLGMPCTYGAGSCQADGQIICSPAGGTICSGMPMGQPEVCDGIDNDCNNIVDDGVCTACMGDTFEPNDTAATATPIAKDSAQWGYLCPGDTDWFELETETGVDSYIYITFPEGLSDLLVRGWVDGVNVVTGDTSGRDYEVFVVHGDINKTFQVEVVDRDGVESFFRVSLVTNRACNGDDGFTPNQTIQTAAAFPPFWSTDVTICSGGISDWYALGDLTAGEAFYAGIAGEAFGTDLDLHLWGDPDGDNVFERMVTSANFDNVEDIDVPVPHTGRFYLQVVDFDGYGGPYTIGWSVQ